MSALRLRHAGLVFFWIGALALAGTQVMALCGWDWVLAGLLFPLGWALADLFAGTIHWFFDRYGTREWPLVGHVVADFRDHHTDPKGILEGDLLKGSAKSATAGIPFVAALAWMDLPPWLTLGLLSWLLGSALTNSIHQISHMDAPPPVFQTLQRWRIILPPDEHRRHHHGDHSVAYCITNGWMNPVLEHLQVYERIQAVFPPMVAVEPKITPARPRQQVA